MSNWRVLYHAKISSCLPYHSHPIKDATLWCFFIDFDDLIFIVIQVGFKYDSVQLLEHFNLLLTHLIVGHQ